MDDFDYIVCASFTETELEMLFGASEYYEQAQDVHGTIEVTGPTILERCADWDEEA